MTLRFIIDAQLPPALAGHLKASGYGAEHVNRISLGGAADARVWSYVVRKEAVLITKDEDFIELARRTADGPAVIWIRLGNTTNRALWAVFSRVLPEVLAGLRAGERVIVIE
jgi:predicted nuclease of predicted toxin-antitoxin system